MTGLQAVHVGNLIGHVDWLILPRIISVNPKAFMCPKVLGLTDMVRNIFPALPGILDPTINLKPPRPRGFAQALEQVGMRFTDNILIELEKLRFSIQSGCRPSPA